MSLSSISQLTPYNKLRHNVLNKTEVHKLNTQGCIFTYGDKIINIRSTAIAMLHSTPITLIKVEGLITSAASTMRKFVQI